MFFECFENTAAGLHVLFDLIVRLHKSWHQLDEVANEILRDDYHAFQRVTEDDVALNNDASQVMFTENEAGGRGFTGEISTPLTVTGVLRAYTLASAPVPTVDFEKAQI